MTAEATWTPVIPIPDDAPKAGSALSIRVKRNGREEVVPFTGDKVWFYHDAEGRCVCGVARFDWQEDGVAQKEYRPFTLWTGGNGCME
jgi:hypothetical protein